MTFHPILSYSRLGDIFWNLLIAPWIIFSAFYLIWNFILDIIYIIWYLRIFFVYFYFFISVISYLLSIFKNQNLLLLFFPYCLFSSLFPRDVVDFFFGNPRHILWAIFSLHLIFILLGALKICTTAQPNNYLRWTISMI